MKLLDLSNKPIYFRRNQQGVEVFEWSQHIYRSNKNDRPTGRIKSNKLYMDLNFLLQAQPNHIANTISLLLESFP